MVGIVWLPLQFPVASDNALRAVPEGGEALESAGAMHGVYGWAVVLGMAGGGVSLHRAMVSSSARIGARLKTYKRALRVSGPRVPGQRDPAAGNGAWDRAVL